MPGRVEWRKPNPELPLQRAEVRLLDAMWAHAGNDGLVSGLSARVLGERSGAGTYSTVRYALRWLAMRGGIERVAVGSRSVASTWRVLLTVDELAARVGVHPGVVL